MDYYDVSPRVVPANRTSEICIRPRFKHAQFKREKFKQEQIVKVLHLPFDGLNQDGVYVNRTAEEAEWHMDGETLVLRAAFRGEQEHSILVYCKAEGKDEFVRCGFRIYSVEPDLYEMRPYRGNFHIHTTGSDGKEEPSYVAARYRQKGFDFAAISDHGQYNPSLEAIRFWEKLNLNFRLYPGEEVHAKNNPVHIIHFGGRYSVNDLWRDNPEQYEKEVNAIRETMPDKNPSVDNFAIASSQWVFEKIREADGLSVFCHPYWYTSRYEINEGITGEIFKRRGFDAFEVLGGHFKHQFESNNFQVVRYYEEQAKGNRFPVVGLDDSHGTDDFRTVQAGPVYTGSSDCALFGWYSTIVLAKSDSVQDLIDGIRGFRSCAVSAIEGEIPRIYGTFRMTRYVSFLLREYFPMHDHFCAEEGALMLDYLAGDKNADDAIRLLTGRTAAYREKAFRDTYEK